MTRVSAAPALSTLCPREPHRLEIGDGKKGVRIHDAAAVFNYDRIGMLNSPTERQDGAMSSEASSIQPAGSAEPITSARRSDEFYLAEYKALREEICLTIKNQYDAQRAVAISVGAIYAVALQIEVIATKPPPQYSLLALWVAPFIVAFVAYRANVYSEKTLLLIGDYIRTHIELNFPLKGQAEHGGWETRLFELRKNQSILSVASIFWVAILLATFVAGAARVLALLCQ
jgi:hypothetical protein